MSQPRVNPDQSLLRRFIEAGQTNVAVDTNPVALDLEGRLTAWNAAERTLELAFTTGDRHMQGNGVVQGGIVATMLDFGVAFAAMASDPRMAVTAALNIQFERAVRPGHARVRAIVHRVGGRLAFASAELRGTGEEVLARATATLAVFE